MKKYLNQELIDLQEAAIRIGKCGLSFEQAMENIIKAQEGFKMISFAVENKAVLIEDYTRQAIL